MHGEYIKRSLRAENVHSTDWERPRMGLMAYLIEEVKAKTNIWDKISIRTDGKIVTGYVRQKYKNFVVVEIEPSGYCEAFQRYDIITKRREKNDSNRTEKD